MKLLSAYIPPNCDIVLYGDIHEGNISTSRDGLARVHDYIRSGSNRLFCMMGDEIEAITTEDKRYQVDTTTEPIPLKQARNIIETFKPIADRGLVWLNGNHNQKLHRIGNITNHIADELKIPYGTYTCKLALQDRHGPIAKLYLTHGYRTLTSNAKDFEQRIANMKAQLKVRLLHKAGDCLVMAMGHTHKLLVVDPAQRLIITDNGQELQQQYLGPGDGTADYIEPDRRWYVNTGSFLRTFTDGVDGYAERAGYDPVELGCAIVEIRDRRIAGVRRMVVG